jgi:DNA-binding response OmpR family regulator
MKIPVLILSALTLEKDVIKHLKLGACDYMKKPFSPNELVARINNLIRRCE